mgnify:CR=1 FL=1
MTEEKNEVIFDDDKISKSEEFVNPDELYQELIQCVQKYHPSDDISMIEKAYKVASEAHKNQFRKSGEPYIIHPLNVAIILADLKLDKETIVAGILHDVVEDTVMTEEDLRREFGDDVALLVDGVTKLEKIPLSGSNGEQSDAKLEMQAENLRKMFLSMAQERSVNAQYAHVEVQDAGESAEDCQRDTGDLLSHRPETWYQQTEDRTG